MSEIFCRDFFYFFNKKPNLYENIVELMPQYLQAKICESLNLCFSDKPFTQEFQLIIPRKESVVLEIRSNPIIHVGKLMFILLEITNINAQNKYRFNAQKQKKALNDYSFFTSHILREPVSHILSMSQILNDSQIGPHDFLKINEMLTDLQGQAKKLDKIMLTLSSLLIDESYLDLDPKRLLKKDILSIALVDDDSLINKIHKHLIQKHFPNIQIVTFNNPIDALKKIAQTTPQLVLLDINMPQIDGWKFLHQMDIKMISSEVIIVSSSIDPHEKIKAFRYKRVKGFLNKPLTYAKIQKILT